MIKTKFSAWLLPFLLVFYEIATYLSNDMYLPALPDMMLDLNLSLSQIQLTLTMWFLGAASMPIVVGGLSDRFGRRRILLIGGIIYILATVVCALVSDYHIFLLARFIEGSMISFMLVPGYACIHESYNQKQAIAMLALMSSISVLAPALGPLLGSFILSLTHDWRMIFWAIVAWSSLVILLLGFYMPETLAADKREPLHLLRILHRYKLILTNKHFVMPMLVCGFTMAGFIAWITASPLLIIETFKQSAFIFGIAQVIVFSVNILASRMVKYAMEVIHIKHLVRVGLFSAIAGALFILISCLFTPNLNYFIIGMSIYSFGSGLNFACLNRLAVDASDQPMGSRVAMVSIFFTGCAALGSAVTSLIYNGSPLSLAAIIGGFICLSLLCLPLVDYKYYQG